MNPKSTYEVKTWLDKLTADKRLIVNQLRTQVASNTPDVHEFVYHDQLVYRPVDEELDYTIYIVYIAVLENYVNLGFFFGAYLEDPDVLLIGKGKRMRHVRISSQQEAANPAIAKLLKQAWDVSPRQVIRKNT